MNTEFLRERFEYRDGRLYYRKTIKSMKQGDVAGFLADDSGCIRRHIYICNRRMTHARVVWMYHHGAIPKNKTVDHINRDATDDRIENLRLANMSEQSRNRCNNIPQQSGVQGVTFHTKRKQWRVFAKIDGKVKQVGAFKELEDAIKKRKEYP